VNTYASAPGSRNVDLDDGEHVLARSLVRATGARGRELDAEGIERFRGAGVYHAAMPTDAERSRDEDVIVLGGGNSAEQAATNLATRARSARIVVRGAHPPNRILGGTGLQPVTPNCRFRAIVRRPFSGALKSDS
jgi:thioredoxin reductase (NADPH)